MRAEETVEILDGEDEEGAVDAVAQDLNQNLAPNPVVPVVLVAPVAGGQLLLAHSCLGGQAIPGPILRRRKPIRRSLRLQNVGRILCRSSRGAGLGSFIFRE